MALKHYFGELGEVQHTAGITTTPLDKLESRCLARVASAGRPFTPITGARWTCWSQWITASPANLTEARKRRACPRGLAWRRKTHTWMFHMIPDKKPWPYAAIALSLLGLVLLDLFCMVLLFESMMTMPGDGAQPWLQEKALALGAMIIALPLMLISAAVFAIAGIRAGRTVLANQIICGLAFAVLLMGAWLAGIFSLSILS